MDDTQVTIYKDELDQLRKRVAWLEKWRDIVLTASSIINPRKWYTTARSELKIPFAENMPHRDAFDAAVIRKMLGYD